MKGASLRISTFYLGIVILGLFSVRPGLAADEVTEIAPEGSEKQIEARAYDLKTIRPSRSGRVYLFQKADADFPVDGKIFLLRQGETPVMAFRVLKTYPAAKRIAAKKLLPYDGFPKLARGSQYRAYEKIGNKVLPVPPTPEDLKDLQDLEGTGSPEDVTPPPLEDLPAPPADEAAPVQLNEFAEPSTEENPEIENIEDEDEYDEIGNQYPNFVTMAVGLLFNSNIPGPNPKLGGGLLYSRNLGSSWAIEAGFYYYKSTDTTLDITATVMPLIGNLRYHWRMSELFTGYLYGGFSYPYISAQVGASTRQLAVMQQVTPAFGAGFFLQTGPNWYLRLNAGYDSITTGVMLRF